MEGSSDVKHKESSCCLSADCVFKVIILGDSCVGKTCLAYRFSTGKFPNKTEVTIGVDFFEKVFELGGEIVKLQLWDTAGQERFRRSMISHYYRNVHAVIFMYDITRKASFESLPNWLEECNHHIITSEVPRVLIGNKCDLSNERVVNSNFARKFADIHNMPLWEISVRNDYELETINSIFLTLVHKLKAHKPLMVFPPWYSVRDWENLHFDKMNHIYQPYRQGSIRRLPVKKEIETEKKKKCACS